MTYVIMIWIKQHNYFQFELYSSKSNAKKRFWLISMNTLMSDIYFLYTRPTKVVGAYTGFTLSVRPSLCPSICL